MSCSLKNYAGKPGQIPYGGHFRADLYENLINPGESARNHPCPLASGLASLKVPAEYLRLNVHAYARVLLKTRGNPPKFKSPQAAALVRDGQLFDEAAYQVDQRLAQSRESGL